jgi:hypothetical protein
MYKLHISGDHYPPYKGVYYRPTYIYNTYDELLFNHFGNDLDQNDEVCGLRGSELDNFTFMASLHNVDVVIDSVS